MKKFLNFFVCISFLIVLPFCFFGCDELTFDDVPYVQTTDTIQDVIKNVNDSRAFMINNIQLPVLLKATNVYTFSKTQDERFEDKVVKDEIEAQIGKAVSSNPSVAIISTTRYVGNKKLFKETKHYVKTKNESDDVLSSYIYTTHITYLEDTTGRVQEETTYSRQEYNSNNINFLGLFNSVVPVIETSSVQSIYKKEFEGVDYYKFTSGIDTYSNILEAFDVSSSLSQDPQLFLIDNARLDYVMPFSCEFGLKETDGYNYISYSTINYTIENKNREKYLSVSSKSTLEKYGEEVKPKKPEDVDIFTANTFVDTLRQDRSLITYTSSSGAKITCLKLEKTNEISGAKYYDYSVKMETSTPTYYYLKYNLGSSTYTCYKLVDTFNKLYEVDNSFELELLKFDFNQKYNSKTIVDETARNPKYYYKFGDGENYFNVLFNLTEVAQIKTKDNFVLNIVFAPTIGNTQNFVEDISLYSLAS